MEEKIAILIADLSGYTAVTEIHGASTAADLIDKFIAIVNGSLVGDSTFHQRVGDEILLFSSSPDNLLLTAEFLMNKLWNENNFLQLHGALHFGSILKRGENYFGTALNLTSRIAGEAEAGMILCSEDFIASLSDETEVRFKSIGKHTFKNLSEEKELFQAIFKKGNSVFIDPVCRMIVEKTALGTKHPIEGDVYFCSEACLNIYNHLNVKAIENR